MPSARSSGATAPRADRGAREVRLLRPAPEPARTRHDLQQPLDRAHHAHMTALTSAGAAPLLSPEAVAVAQASAHQLVAGLDRVILGQPDFTRMAVVACLARGH